MLQHKKTLNTRDCSEAQLGHWGSSRKVERIQICSRVLPLLTRLHKAWLQGARCHSPFLNGLWTRCMPSKKILSPKRFRTLIWERNGITVNTYIPINRNICISIGFLINKMTATKTLSARPRWSFFCHAFPCQHQQGICMAQPQCSSSECILHLCRLSLPIGSVNFLASLAILSDPKLSCRRQDTTPFGIFGRRK